MTAVIYREGTGFVSLCPELDIASQGDTIEAARDNLREALELFFECAPPTEVQERFGEEVDVARIEVVCNQIPRALGLGGLRNYAVVEARATPD